MFASGSNAPMLDLSFPTEVIVTGMKFTTHKDRALQRVRIRANSDPANPDDFETPPQPLHSIQSVSQHRNASIKMELFLFRCFTCTRAMRIHLLRRRSRKPFLFQNHWLQPRSEWTTWSARLDLFSKWKSLE